MTKEQMARAKEIDFELAELARASFLLDSEYTHISVVEMKKPNPTLLESLNSEAYLGKKLNTEFKKIVEKEIERLEKELEAL